MPAVLEPIRAALKTRKASASWNLHLDKLSFERNQETGTKKVSLDSIRQSYADPRTQNHLLDACKRHRTFRDLLRHCHGMNYREIILVNSSRLLMHLGRASVLENVGLACERSTGLPVIPGSAVKGIVSSWACWEANLLADGTLPASIPRKKQERAHFISPAEQILGSNAETGSISAGEIAFLGGFPIMPPKLVLDILTPHEKGTTLPNPFLALDPGTRWVFPLVSHSRRGGDDELLTQTASWVIDALTQVGIGAKTAAGYGRFRILSAEEAAQEEIEQAAAVAAEKAKLKAAEAAASRLEAQKVKQAADEAEAKKKAAYLASLAPEDLAYAQYVETVTDWVAQAREIGSKPPIQKQHIVRFFRTPEGQHLLNSWVNEKGKQRIQNLKEAGL